MNISNTAEIIDFICLEHVMVVNKHPSVSCVVGSLWLRLISVQHFERNQGSCGTFTASCVSDSVVHIV
jgi:hypothetical protein